MLAREEADTAELLGEAERVLRGKDKRNRVGSNQRSSVAIAGEGIEALESLVADLNQQMLEAAAELKFELAARIRDELSEIKRELRNITRAGHD
jgi:excinuclease ABC subunit B